MFIQKALKCWVKRIRLTQHVSPHDFVYEQIAYHMKHIMEIQSSKMGTGISLRISKKIKNTTPVR